MPTIPVYHSQLDPRSTIDGRSADANDFGAGKAAAIGSFASTVDALAQHMNKVHQEAQLVSTAAAANRDLQDFTTSLTEGSVDANGGFIPPPPIEQHQKLFEDKVKEIDNSAKKTLTDNDYYLEFQRQFAGQANTHYVQMQKAGIQHAKDSALATADDAINTYTQSAAVSSGMAREQAVHSAANTIDMMANAGVISKVDAVTRKEALARNIDVADVKADLRDPKTAIKNLENPAMYPNLKPGERQTYITQAIAKMDQDMREQQAAADRADRMFEKNQRIVQRNLGKTADDMLSRGTLTESWISANRDQMSEADHRYFLDKLNNPRPHQSDPNVYSDLRIRQSAGQDVATDAQAAYQSGDITYGAFNTLTTTDGDNPTRKKTWYKDGENYIRTSFYIDRYSAEAQKHLLAETLDGWREWSDAHPNATPDEARKEVRLRAAAGAMIDFDKNPAAWPIPRYVTTGRASITQDVLRAGWQRLAKDRDAGTLSQSDYAQQADLYAQWLSYVRLRESMAAAAKAAPARNTTESPQNY